MNAPFNYIAKDLWDATRRPDRERAREYAQRILKEAPDLVQPDLDLVNLAAYFTDLLYRIEGLER